MIPQVEFSIRFWEELKTPKRHFKINQPLIGVLISETGKIKSLKTEFNKKETGIYKISPFIYTPNFLKTIGWEFCNSI